jgi:hypothetical protein
MSHQDVPRKSEPVDTSSGNHTFAMDVDGIYYGGTAGTITAQLRDDTAARAWPVPAGQMYLLGRFIKVMKVGTDLTGLVGIVTDGPG